MINKIKSLIIENISDQKKILRQAKEIEWAHVYHDSIRGREWLQNMPLNIGRWAGNYSFFYVLNRILMDYRPSLILELGLGESTKFVSAYLANELKNSEHLIIEQNEDWRDQFIQSFSLPVNSEIKICLRIQGEVKGNTTYFYENLKKVVDKKYDLYIIDGPIGSKNYSRYDMVNLIEDFLPGDEFIMIVDDYDRIGEKESVEDLTLALQNKEIKIYTEVYSGVKDVCVIATEKYRFVTGL